MYRNETILDEYHNKILILIPVLLTKAFGPTGLSKLFNIWLKKEPVVRSNEKLRIDSFYIQFCMNINMDLILRLCTYLNCWKAV